MISPKAARRRLLRTILLYQVAPVPGLLSTPTRTHAHTSAVREGVSACVRASEPLCLRGRVARV
eukprot:1960734-Pleurochrysis_carterae.AAC.2